MFGKSLQVTEIFVDNVFFKSSGPLVGKYLSIWGVKAIFPAGFIIDGGTFIMFGMLQWVSDTTMFLLFSYLIRFLEVSHMLRLF